MRRLSLKAAPVLGLVALAAVIAACGGASAAPTDDVTPPASPVTSPADPGTPAGGPVSIVAKDMAFTTPSVTVPAGTPFTIDFDNQDGAPHNVAIADAAGTPVYKGEIVSATKVAYPVPALAAGTYTFICEIHPDMKGTITAK